MGTPADGVSFAQQFVDRVTLTPDAAAFQHRDGASWKTLSWRQTREQVDLLAAGLVALGVQSEQRVAIACSTRIEWILADLAIMCAGAATTTVYPTTAAEEVHYILSDSQSSLVIAENPDQARKVLAEQLPDLLAIVLIDGDASGLSASLPVLTWRELLDKGRELLADKPSVVSDRIATVGPESLATLIYTSGTTGRPKGVRLVHANWSYEGSAVSRLGILNETDVQYLWLPLSHVFGKMLIGMQLEIGFSTAVDGDLDKIVENLAIVRPTFMAGAPRIFEKVRSAVTLRTQGEGGIKAKLFNWAIAVGLAASRKRQRREKVTGVLGAQLAVADALVFKKIRAAMGGNIKFFVSGSAALSREVAEWFDGVGLKILEGYGLTETSAACAVNLPEDTRIGTVGPPLPGTEFVIASDGEILIRGGGVMRGYQGMQSETEEVLTADGWFHTGDIGELVDGYLRVTDRKKDLIKTSGGKYIAPQKIEGLFKAVFPYSSQIVVHADGRKYASALITLDMSALQPWADRNGLSGRSEAELSKDQKVIDLVQGGIDEMNGKLERWETIKRFAILPRDLTIEAGELTPSLKVRRKAVEKQYLDVLDTLYPKD
jgi:long-chain acyl-CoA synthetase